MNFPASFDYTSEVAFVLHLFTEVESRTQGSRPRPRTQKKIRGQRQGQPFRGQTLSRPRTGMPEAKDQEHSRKCSPKKKKGLQKSFSGNLQFIGVTKNFDWVGGQNHKSHAMTSSKFSKEDFFWGQRYHGMEDLKSLPVGT